MNEQNVNDNIVSVDEVTSRISYVKSIDVKLSDVIVIDVFEEKR